MAGGEEERRGYKRNEKKGDKRKREERRKYKMFTVLWFYSVLKHTDGKTASAFFIQHNVPHNGGIRGISQ